MLNLTFGSAPWTEMTVIQNSDLQDIVGAESDLFLNFKFDVVMLIFILFALYIT